LPGFLLCLISGAMVRDSGCAVVMAGVMPAVLMRDGLMPAVLMPAVLMASVEAAVMSAVVLADNVVLTKGRGVVLQVEMLGRLVQRSLVQEGAVAHILLVIGVIRLWFGGWKLVHMVHDGRGRKAQARYQKQSQHRISPATSPDPQDYAPGLYALLILARHFTESESGNRRI
jgi:hypothetical protein